MKNLIFLFFSPLIIEAECLRVEKNEDRFQKKEIE